MSNTAIIIIGVGLFVLIMVFFLSLYLLGALSLASLLEPKKKPVLKPFWILLLISTLLTTIFFLFAYVGRSEAAGYLVISFSFITISIAVTAAVLKWKEIRLRKGKSGIPLVQILFVLLILIGCTIVTYQLGRSWGLVTLALGMAAIQLAFLVFFITVQKAFTKLVKKTGGVMGTVIIFSLAVLIGLGAHFWNRPAELPTYAVISETDLKRAIEECQIEAAYLPRRGQASVCIKGGNAYMVENVTRLLVFDTLQNQRQFTYSTSDDAKCPLPRLNRGGTEDDYREFMQKDCTP